MAGIRGWEVWRCEPHASDGNTLKLEFRTPLEMGVEREALKRLVEEHGLHSGEYVALLHRGKDSEAIFFSVEVETLRKATVHD